MTVLPKDMFGFNAMAIGHGFLVPGHATGGLSIINLDEPESKPYEISAELNNWFYHKAYAIDMDGDGLLDFVTARCRDNVIPFPWNPENKGTLVWLRNPGGEEPLTGENNISSYCSSLKTNPFRDSLRSSQSAGRRQSS
jgi:hypothetical protein